MKKSLFLYLFIVAVLMNIFTYKYFSTKGLDEFKTLTTTNKKLKDSITSIADKMYDANYFSLENNDRALNYLEKYEAKDIINKVQQALLAYNDSKDGNQYTGQIKLSEQKFIINKMKVINHRWIIADYSNGTLWGDALIKYFVNDDETISFEVIESYLYPASLN